MSFGHSIPIYSHFATQFMAFKRLVHAVGDNRVELSPAASRWMVVRGWFVSAIRICCCSSISVCRKERQTVTDLYYPKNSLPFAFLLEKLFVSRNDR